MGAVPRSVRNGGSPFLQSRRELLWRFSRRPMAHGVVLALIAEYSKIKKRQANLLARG